MSSDPTGRRLHRDHLITDPLRSIDARVRLDIKKAIPAVLIALICFGLGDHLGGVGGTRDARYTFGSHHIVLTKGRADLIVVGLCIVFVIAGVIATRSIARELNRVSTSRGGPAAGSAISLVCNIVGYITVFLGLLSLLRVNFGNLLVGGAVTGVVIGIAAQQTLGNFFAGLILLFARPFVPGQWVRVNTGAMGGPFEGTILGQGLMYTTIQTEAGVISMPNSGLLAAAIGPVGEPAADDPTEPGEELSADGVGREEDDSELPKADPANPSKPI